MNKLKNQENKLVPLSRALIAIWLALTLSFALKAGENVILLQQNTVTGTVIDSKTSEAMPGVSVLISGTTRGVVTDIDGKFSIEALTTDVLIFSFVGYITEEFLVGSNTRIQIELNPDVIDLSEVVVIGYGTQKKSDLTGAITSVSEDQLKAQPVASIDQALQGKAAGVIVQQSSGSPAGGVSVLVRGATSINSSNQPLYVVDGIVISDRNTGGLATMDQGQGGQTSNPLASISPDDIQSIEILKDASATAIYGVRGANGVVLVTTKRGTQGKSTLSFNMYYGFQQLPKKLDVLNSYDYSRYRLMQHVALINEDTYPIYELPLDPTDDQIPFTTLHPDSFPVNTNWQDEMYQTAPMQDYHLSAGGGTEKVKYNISGGYYQVDGILIGSAYERLSLKSNIDATLSKWFQMGNSLILSYSKEDMSFNDAYYGGGMVERALQQRPDMPVYDEDGNYAGPSSDMEASADNPIAAELEKQNDNKVSRIIGNVYAQVNILKGLSFRSIFGADLSNSRTTIFEPSVSRGGYYKEFAEMNDAIQQNTNWSSENYFTYTYKIASSHDISLMAGLSAYYTKWDQFSAYRDNFPSNETRNLNLGSTENMANGAYAGDVAMQSMYGRLVYSFKDYFTFTHTSRYDGSSKFSEEFRYDYFPSFAGAWKITSHDFMDGLPFISFMKVRVGYGITGNDNVDPVEFVARLRPVEVAFGNTVYPAYEPDGKDNPGLHWEKVKSFNAGIDLNFLENRLQLISDFYIRRSVDMIIETPTPFSASPFGSPWLNCATMENRGFEVNLISNNFSGGFEWSTTATYSYNRNEAIDLAGTVIFERIRTQDPMITQTAEGYPIAQFYGFVTDGLFRTQQEIDDHAFQNGAAIGDIRFKDLNGDGVIDDNDKAYIGNPIPMHVFGLTNNFSYKGLDISIFLQGMMGNKVFNMVRRNMESMKGANNQFTVVLDAFSPEEVYMETPDGTYLVAEQNTDTDIPRMTQEDLNDNTRISDRWVEDASFLKIQTVTLGYTLPRSVTERIRVQRLRIYMTGKNLYTFTPYSGYEPEHGALENNALLSGIDLGNYPVPRSIVFGVNLDF
jgi:TonB-dependent starch-binding outer membrane protein SusC